jgi:energy-coupling factor transport system ATP-binding protein
MIELKNVRYNYPGSASAINGINLSIEPGEFVSIIGSNGAGKSTLLRLIRALLKPTSGEIFIDGENIRSLRASALARKIGFLFQNPDRQLCKSSVRDELLYSLECADVDASLREGMVDEAITRFNLDPQANPASLSRGEKQHVALLSAIIAKPRVLLLDEPTTGLDFRECEGIMREIAAMNQAGTTVAMVCHDMEVTLDYAGRVVAIHGGEIVADGSPKDVFYGETAARARVTPPQIIELSLLLNKRYGSGVTPAQLADEIAREARQ